MKKTRFLIADIIYICMMILPILAGIILKVLTTPETVGISITGAQIYLDIPFPVQNLVITSAQINSWLVMISISGLALFTI